MKQGRWPSPGPLLRSPRTWAVLVCLYLGLFALAAFSGAKPLLRAIADFVVHLAPVIVLLGVVALSRRREWLGGFVFTALAAAYAYLARRHLDWVIGVSGPLLLVGILYLRSWGRRTAAAAG
jgi:hypothetical protein